MKTHRIAIDPESGEAYLADTGVSVWALIAYLQQAVGGDIERAAEDYEISVDDVARAIAYYQQHQAQIDARILSNAAPLETITIP